MSKSAVVHCQTVLMVVDVVGSMLIILFALTGKAVEVLIGNMLLATIHVVAKTFLTALFVFSTNLLDFLVFALDSIELIEFGLLIMNDAFNVLKHLLV
ncbi:hypothetical protein IKO50_00870 [bacterium]|nr:hypothetical protein [bacterium]